ncbi:hypothetical protein V2G26_008696 [Clonostachys chloroleuca]
MRDLHACQKDWTALCQPRLPYWISGNGDTHSNGDERNKVATYGGQRCRSLWVVSYPLQRRDGWMLIGRSLEPAYVLFPTSWGTASGSQ